MTDATLRRHAENLAAQPKICPLCDRAYAGVGNNARPFAGRCCDDCDDVFVTPARIMRLDPQDGALGEFVAKFMALGKLQRQMRDRLNEMRRNGG